MTNAVRRMTGRSALAALVLAGLVSTGTSMGAPLPDGGADAGGGSGAAGLLDQNTALDGRQNNACGDSQRLTGSGVLDGSGQITTDCSTSARSHSTDTLTTGDGAQATAGDGVPLQQNTAERGRQNNACGNSIESGLYDGETDTNCAARDQSVSKKTVTHAGPAQATGGSGYLFQQNTAQQGRQNNACGNLNNGTLSGTTEVRCAAHDGSVSKGTDTHGDGAKADGGNSTLGASQQNTAQEGRQNNACGNMNNVGLPGDTEAGCATHDGSVSKGTATHGGGAKADGGDSQLSSTQQNIAQEGRQNNACGNANVGSVSGEAKAHCATHDGSVSKGTATHGGGAKADGGDSTAELTQQNIAQEGRQNNACGNTNSLTLDEGGTNAQCSAVDESVEIRSKKHG
ncbi:hypothetical protein [Streptomyces sp. NBC_00878]|uniref:hypothetical protein n=1 Tax=Streptomyces sp. NBC_00878 TaxID=2975854 RepID=UPI00225583B2|nr:hypothetical protein [Streptomyces sp. NBC_00878]MCX4905255.1 hypothetical protein [Streptomyces sp. NBC_00878]